MITHGSLFAGIGGFDLGFQRAGITTLWDVEIDPYCQAVLRKNFPDTEIYSDVKEVGKHNLKYVDIISGGFPCQPFSYSGKRGGKEDDRYLWPPMFRIISEIKPTWVVCENVPGIDGMVLEEVLIDLESIGYETAPPLEIPACSVGADHRRKRIWILAYSDRSSGNSGSEPVRRPERSDIGRRSEGSDVAIAAIEDDRKSNAREAERQEPEFRESGCGKTVADTNSPGLEKREGNQATSAVGIKLDSRTDVSNSNFVNDVRRRHATSEVSREQSGQARIFNRQQWPVEPDVGRVVNGVSEILDSSGMVSTGPTPKGQAAGRQHRIRGVGSAIVPQIAEQFGYFIVDIMEIINA